MSASSPSPTSLPPLNARALLLALLITGIWGVNFVVIKWSVADAPPLLVAALRFALAALPAVLFVPRPQMPARLLWAALAQVLLFGIWFEFSERHRLFMAPFILLMAATTLTREQPPRPALEAP